MTIHVALTEGKFSLKEAISFGCQLTKRLDTTLIGVSAMPDPARAVLMTGVSMEGMALAAGSTLAEGIRDAQKSTREELEALFNTICAEHGLAEGRFKAEHHVGLPSEVYPRVTLLTEAFVTPHEVVSTGDDHGMAFETTLLDRKLPVIACGLDAPNLDTVMIAWDGSPEAARAVRFHTGILKASHRIIIAQNEEKIDNQDRGGAEEPEIVSEYLTHLGLASEVIMFDGKVADGLLAMSQRESAGVIVAGAYGHSRVSEFIFGGVSRNLLRAEHGPALALAH